MINNNKIYIFLTFLGLVLAQEQIEHPGLRIALKVFDECSKDVLSTCLKKKAITYIDRLGKIEKFSINEDVKVVRNKEIPIEKNLNEIELDKTLPRDANAQDDALNNIILDKITKFVSSRSIEVNIPKFKVDDFLEEGRGKKMKGMMGGIAMGVAAKMAALVPVAIAVLFMLAGKALITAKIALLLSGILAIKKLFSKKGHHHSVGWQSAGGDGGYQTSGGGWDRRSLVYRAHKP